MNISIDKGCENVSTNFQRIRDFITHLISELEYHGKALESSFTSYLEEIKKLQTGYGNEQNKFAIQTRSYNKIDKMYYRLMKALRHIPQLISEDYNYLLSIGSGLCYIAKRIEVFQERIKATKLIDTVDRYQALAHLRTQLRSALFKYNKLATDYNKEVKRIDTMKSYLARGVIIYSSNTSKKKYTLFINLETDKFVNYVKKDKASQLKSFMIKTLLKRLSQNMINLSKNPITPISLMSLNEIPIPTAPPTNPELLY